MRVNNFSKLFAKKLEESVFFEVLSTLHKKGEFGDLALPMVLEHQYDWFCNFKLIIETDNFIELRAAVLDRNNTITRGWLSKIIGYNVRHIKKDKIEDLIEELAVYRLNKHKLENFGSYIKKKGLSYE